MTLRAGVRPVSIRRALTDDAAEIVALRLALRREERGATASPADPAPLLATTRRQLNGRDQAFFVAELDSTLVAVLRCAIPSPLRSPRFAVLTTAFVVPRHRRRGVLRQLVHAARLWCARRGIADIRVRALAGNHAANAAWEALGFRATEIVRRSVEE